MGENDDCFIMQLGCLSSFSEEEDSNEGRYKYNGNKDERLKRHIQFDCDYCFV